MPLKFKEFKNGFITYRIRFVAGKDLYTYITNDDDDYVTMFQCSSKTFPHTEEICKALYQTYHNGKRKGGIEKTEIIQKDFKNLMRHFPINLEYEV